MERRRLLQRLGTGLAAVTSVALAAAGDTLVSSRDVRVHALDPLTGRERWTA